MALFYCLADKALGERLLPGQRSVLLISALFYFMIPLYPLRDDYQQILQNIEWIRRWNERRMAKTITEMKYSMVTSTDGITYPNWWLSVQMILLFGCLLVALIIMAVRIGGYIRLRRKVRRQIALEYRENARIIRKVERLKEEYHIKRMVDVCILPGAMDSTVGLWRPVIILGRVEEDAEDMDLVLRHELAHISRCDFLIRMLAEFVKIFHWFNPLAYWLARELARVAEYDCDDRVMADADMAKRRRYAKLLVDQKEAAGMRWSPALAEKKSLKRKRVERIMKERKQNKVVTAVVGVLVGLAICLNSLQALAYSGISSLESDLPGYQDFGGANITGVFVPATMTEGEPWIGPDIVYDEQFIDEEGTVWQVTEQTYAVCQHTYEEGTCSKHEVHTDGSCTVYWYNAKRCSKCGNVILGKLTSTIDFNPCIH